MIVGTLGLNGTNPEYHHETGQRELEAAQEAALGINDFREKDAKYDENLGKILLNSEHTADHLRGHLDFGRSVLSRPNPNVGVYDNAPKTRPIVRLDLNHHRPQNLDSLTRSILLVLSSPQPFLLAVCDLKPPTPSTTARICLFPGTVLLTPTLNLYVLHYDVWPFIIP